jgi:hypothetical protein
MIPIIWIFFLSSLGLIYPTISREAHKQDSLLKEVDIILHQIDAQHHHEHGAQVTQTATSTVPQQKSILPSPTPQVTQTPPGTRPRMQPSDIDKAKKQIVEAEKEIAKLKDALAYVEKQEEGGLKKENIARIIHLNQGLIQTYNRQLQAFQTEGLKESDEEVQRIKKEKMHAHHEIGVMQQLQEPRRRRLVRRTAAEVEHTGALIAQNVEKETKKEEINYGGVGAVIQPACGERVINPSSYNFRSMSFAQYEPFVTTRQVFGIQDYLIYLLPQPRIDDANGSDIEARASFQLTNVYGHVGALVRGPEILCGAKPTADISCDFFGPLGINYVPQTPIAGLASEFGVFVPHAAIYLDWECTHLKFGQTWHPREDPKITVSNTRVTFIGNIAEPLTIPAQMRFEQRFSEKFEFVAALIGRIDEKAKINLGINTAQLSNVPRFDFNIQGRIYWCDNIFVIGADIQTVKPRLFDECNWVLDAMSTNTNQYVLMPGKALNPKNMFKTNAGVTGFSMFGFMKLKSDPWIVKAKAIVGTEISMPFGGYAIANRLVDTECDVNNVLLDTPINPQNCWTPMKIASVLADFTFCSKVEPGLFISYIKNLGSKDRLFLNPGYIGGDSFIIFRIRPDLDYVFTISPRLKWNVDPVMIGAEIEFTRAAYGQRQCQNLSNGTLQCALNGSLDDRGKICCPVPVDSVRFLFAIHYYF